MQNRLIQTIRVRMDKKLAQAATDRFDEMRPSNERLALDEYVNKESEDMIEHRRITIEDHYPDYPKDFTLKDLFDIDVAFLIQEIAGIKVLMRGDMLADDGIVDAEIIDETISPQKGEA